MSKSSQPLTRERALEFLRADAIAGIERGATADELRAELERAIEDAHRVVVLHRG